MVVVAANSADLSGLGTALFHLIALFGLSFLAYLTGIAGMLCGNASYSRTAFWLGITAIVLSMPAFLLLVVSLFSAPAGDASPVGVLFFGGAPLGGIASVVLSFRKKGRRADSD